MTRKWRRPAIKWSHLNRAVAAAAWIVIDIAGEFRLWLFEKKIADRGKAIGIINVKAECEEQEEEQEQEEEENSDVEDCGCRISTKLTVWVSIIHTYVHTCQTPSARTSPLRVLPSLEPPSWRQIRCRSEPPEEPSQGCQGRLPRRGSDGLMRDQIGRSWEGSGEIKFHMRIWNKSQRSRGLVIMEYMPCFRPSDDMRDR
jgi:hypothetical protein